MKRERRHELQHNDLAEWILKTYERITPYKNTILGVGLLVVVLLIAWSFWHNHRTAQAAEAWNSLGVPVYEPQFADANTMGRMECAAQTHAGTSAAEWAEVFAGDAALMNGTNKILTDKKAGIDFLNKACEFYDAALKTLTIPAAREQAMFGKARAMESLIENKSQRDEAIKAYQALNENFPNGMFKAVADRQIEQLQKDETLRFYEELAKYTPNKAKVESPRNQVENLSLPEEPLPPTPPVRAVPEPSLTPMEPGKAKSTAAETGAPKSGRRSLGAEVWGGKDGTRETPSGDPGRSHGGSPEPSSAETGSSEER